MYGNIYIIMLDTIKRPIAKEQLLMSVPASEKRRDTQRKKVSLLENFMTWEPKIYFSGFFKLKKKKNEKKTFSCKKENWKI